MGNLWESLRRGQIDAELEWHRKYGKIYGTYAGFDPTLCIADPELIKSVMIKDFNLFVNRRKVVMADDLSELNLFNIEDDHWKRVRAITSPAFTSGKLRGMNALMNQCCDKFVAYFDKITGECYLGSYLYDVIFFSFKKQAQPKTESSTRRKR